MINPSKRPFLSIDGDPITNLPESLVCEILSRLPTKDAIRTSILSKAWQHKWISSCNVFIDKLPWRHPHKKESFINTMNKILLSADYLKSFRFSSLSFDDQSRFQTWLSVILRHKLECFEINLGFENNVYPSSLLNNTSLEKLRLNHFRSTLYVGGKNWAPNLTTVYLRELKIVNDNPNCSTVSFDFPVLEKFSHHLVEWLNVKSVEIRAPSLTAFICEPVYCWDQDYDYSITIFSPRLTRFACSGDAPENFIINGSSVVSAVLVCTGENPPLSETMGLRVKNLVNGFPRLEELYLSRFAVEAILSGPRLHCLDKVIRFRLHNSVSAEQLLALLHAMPSLKFLMVPVYKLNKYDYEAMESVPSCIVSHLEEVVIRSFTRKVPQYDLARFLFKKANRLKKFTAVMDSLCCKTSIVRHHLSTLTRRSPVLKIHAQKSIVEGEFGSYPNFLDM